MHGLTSKLCLLFGGGGGEGKEHNFTHASYLYITPGFIYHDSPQSSSASETDKLLDQLVD